MAWFKHCAVHQHHGSLALNVLVMGELRMFDVLRYRLKDDSERLNLMQQ